LIQGLVSRRRSVARSWVALALASTTVIAGGSPARSATSPAYLTISFGRTQWVQTDATCTPMTGTVALDQVAAAMAQHGFAGVGNVVVNRTAETGPTCVGNYYLSPGWDQLATLRDSDGWSFVSASVSYSDMTQLPVDQQRAESCGSLDAFTSHGHTQAWGLFAYPNNRSDATVQTDVVSTCFAYGRRYARALNVRTSMASPWFANADSVNGGSCNQRGAACSNVQGAPRRYRSPVDLANRAAGVQPDQWLNEQFYRFVTGARGKPGGSGFRWDCTSSDWHLHWTSRTELYCYDDFLAVLNAVGTGVTVTAPATVATAWGRTPPFS
jgi:hypothetical protein